MKLIETSDDRGFEEPRVMRDEATRYEQSWRDKYDDLSRAQCHERLAAADARSDLDTLRRAAFAAAVALGAKLPDDAGPETIATALRQGVERAKARSDVDPRDAVNERIASLSGAARNEALRRASRSYSAPRSAVRDGARLEGTEVVWPDGERYPMAPRHSPARDED